MRLEIRKITRSLIIKNMCALHWSTNGTQADNMVQYIIILYNITKGIRNIAFSNY